MRTSNGIVIAIFLGMNAVATLAAAQGLPRGTMPGLPNEPVIVRVWPGADRCSVLDRNTPCARVSGVLQRASRVSRDTLIQVHVEGTDDEVRVRAAQVMTDIKAAGYRNVRPAGTYQ